MNRLDLDYRKLLQEIIEEGVEKKDRTGVGTKSIFGRTIRHKMKDGFPLLTSKKMAWKQIVTELLWFLRGDTNIKFLIENNCHIWDGDAFANYEKTQKKPKIGDWQNYIDCYCGHTDTCDCAPMNKKEFIEKIKTDDEFAKKWGELGPIYGKQWRSWKKPNHLTGPCEDEYTTDLGFISKEEYEIEKDFYVIDQIGKLINDLKNNPDSRRLMVTAWNVGELDQMVLPPCHYGFQVYTKELSYKERYDIWFKNNYETGMERNYTVVPNFDDDYYQPTPKRSISLMWNQRSVDTFLGLPFNIASYGLLLEIIAKAVNMVPDELIGNLGDTHLYLNHLEAAKEQIGRKYTYTERESMLKAAMGEKEYKAAMKDLMPFGGGMSDYYEFHEIPHHTREPFSLPSLTHMKSAEFYSNLSETASLFNHLTPEDFVIVNYNSHPTIKADLNN